MGNDLLALFQTTGVFYLTPGMLLMWLIGCRLIYLAIAKQYEPLLLFPIDFGIDVGDIAEKTELLGLGQSLIYSIQQTEAPMMLVVLRKRTAADYKRVAPTVGIF